MSRRIPITLALALFLLGGALLAPWTVRTLLTIQLATGVNPEFPNGGCYAMEVTGELISDPEYGTAMVPSGSWATPPIRVPLIWPLGYTARRVPGGDVEVLSATRDVVAITGQTYQFGGPNPPDNPIYADCVRHVPGVDRRYGP